MIKEGRQRDEKGEREKIKEMERGVNGGTERERELERAQSFLE